MWRKHLSALLAVLVVGCHKDESGVITNKAPFYQQGYILPLSDGPKIVTETRGFAKERGLKLLVSTHHFKNGEFSVTLITDDMNIILDNVAKGDKAWLSAVARHEPTAEDKMLLNEYRSFIGLGTPIGDRHPPLVPPAG